MQTQHPYLTLILFIVVQTTFSCHGQTLEATETKALLNTSVTSMNGKARQGEIILLQGIKSKQQFKGITDKNGKFSLLIPEGDNYIIIYKTISGSVKYDTMPIPNKTGIFTYQLTIQYDPPKTYTLDNVFFDTGKSTLKPESYNTLNQLVELLKVKPQMEIEIAGHTDNVGTPESNVLLSQNRAKAVRNYLIQKEIAANRITTQGYGDTQPIASNQTPEGRQQNRRTVVRITKE
ncbi:MAG: OmpA family protein [Bacteroidales bacterium]|jgi:outer membrane protein OmpA-like peptidoglycan-associated protein|nr:OmpA family protein [Bacteroidales bacterium]OQA92777.1 MAG: putative lipoprotein YiaD precursor [Bacteroidetes bacterium ADurb.Bin234]